MTHPQVLPYGDRGVLVLLRDQPAVLALFAELVARPLDGQIDLVPADGSLLVRCADPAAAAGARAEVIRRPAPPWIPDQQGRVAIDVVYDGPDLTEVAEVAGCSADEVVARHSGQDWTVAFTGFAPGFGYLLGEVGGPPVPRRATPRTRVPAGSVALGGRYSAIYPRSSPGGWQLIGRSTEVLWDLRQERPALLQPGMRVRFRPVDTLPPPPMPVAAAPYSFGGPDGPGLRLDRSGALALVQDAGRAGLGASGVPESGAADAGAAAAANRAVGNAPDAAVLEFVLGGAQVSAVGDQLVAVAGAATDLQHRPADGPPASVPPGRALLLRDGDRLRLGRVAGGLRSYLAVRGGIACPPVLGSRSTDRLSGLGPPPVGAGALLAVGRVDRLGEAPRTPAPVRPRQAPVLLAVTAGPHRAVLPDDVLVHLCSRQWRVTPETDRVGVRLTGSPLPGGGGALPSAPLVAGAVQLPPSGLPVVFLRDHPTTGGYPVIAVLGDAAIDSAAQLRPGESVRFHQLAGSAG